MTKLRANLIMKTCGPPMSFFLLEATQEALMGSENTCYERWGLPTNIESYGGFLEVFY